MASPTGLPNDSTETLPSIGVGNPSGGSEGASLQGDKEGLLGVTTVYSNPATDEFTIRCDFGTPEWIKLYDVMGRVVLQEKGDKNTINIKNFQKGVYFLEVCLYNRTWNGKIVKQ